jgi:hypothetical protein
MEDLIGKIAQQKSMFVCKNTGEELLLIPLKDNVADFNQYLVLNALGAFIWEALDSSITIDLLQEKILTEFEVTTEQLNADLEKFLPDLHHYTCST